MKISIKLFCLFFVLCFALQASAQTKDEKDFKDGYSRFLIRLDDVGMTHATNMATKKLLDTNLPFSTSVLTVSPWFAQAAQLLKKYDNVAVGVHLALNAEWEQLRWGPVLGKDAVPSLVDSLGYFRQEAIWQWKQKPNIGEVEMEFRAQIERAMDAGLPVCYIDTHMGLISFSDEFKQVIEKLAKEYELGISRYFDEIGVKGIEGFPLNQQTDSLLARAGQIPANKTGLMIIHPGWDSPDMKALTLPNQDPEKSVGMQRYGSVRATLSNDFASFLQNNKVQLVNYFMVIKNQGLDAMRYQNKKINY